MSNFPLKVGIPTDRPSALLTIAHAPRNVAAFRPLRKTTIWGIPQIILHLRRPLFRRTT